VSDVAAALELPSDFACDDDRIGRTWSLGPCIDSRDCKDPLTKANAKALLKALNEHPEWENDWYTLSASHWGWGWLEHLAFRVLRKVSPSAEGAWQEPDLEEYPGYTTTAIYQFMLDWAAHQQEFIVMDEELLAEEEQESAMDFLLNYHPMPAKQTLPDDWMCQLYRHLYAKGHWCIESDGSPFVDREHMIEALKELDYYDDDS
jgi:hypothetical protein